MPIPLGPVGLYASCDVVETAHLVDAMCPARIGVVAGQSLARISSRAAGNFFAMKGISQRSYLLLEVPEKKRPRARFCFLEFSDWSATDRVRQFVLDQLQQGGENLGCAGDEIAGFQIGGIAAQVADEAACFRN